MMSKHTLAAIVVLLVLPGCDASTIGPRTAPGRLNKIAARYERGDVAGVITGLNDYLRAYPRDDLAWTMLGNAYKGENRLDEAQEAYEKALSIDPRCFRAVTGKGILHSKRGELDEAIAAYEAALKIDPTYAHAYSSMTVIALKQGDDAKALRYARKGYELNKTDPVIAANLALAYHYIGDTENRDRMTRVAEQLRYRKIDVLKRIYSGEMTIRD